jgi:quercetin dioxygenase-like cupin family protein
MEKIIEDQYAEEIKKISKAGYSDITLKEIEPNLDTDFHTHDFDAYACVVKGKFILHYNNKKHVLKPGNFLAVDAKQLHSEKTSSLGATILIGKKYKN